MLAWATVWLAICESSRFALFHRFILIAESPPVDESLELDLCVLIQLPFLWLYQTSRPSQNKSAARHSLSTPACRRLSL